MQTTISSKYQVVIPKPAREHLNLQPKQKLTVIQKFGVKSSLVIIDKQAEIR